MKPFTRLGVFLLSVVAALHLVRYLAGRPVLVDGIAVPLWLSAVFAAIAGTLALMIWREAKR